MRNIISDSNKRGQKYLSTMIHFLCIAIIVFLPEVVMNIGDPYSSTLPANVFAKSILFIVVYYINYFFIIDKCFNAKHSTLIFSISNIIILITSLIIIYIVWDYKESSEPMHEYLPPHPLAPTTTDTDSATIFPGDTRFIARALSLFLRDGVMIIMAMSLALAVKLSSKWIAEKEHRQMLITVQKEEELKNFKNQLNPHFLFNTLNSIYALIDISPQKSKEAVHELSHMLRYILYETPSAVELQMELNFINSYIDLMKIRFHDKTPINVTLDAGNCEKMKIAPLIFISLVENVFKHGNTGNPCHQMEISITVKDGIVTCHTFNYCNTDNQSSNTGIGLNNLKQRLNLIYGEKAMLSISKNDSTFAVDLKIDLN